MTITTANGAKFNTELPARSNIVMVLDDNGCQVMDTLRITGNMEAVMEFQEPMSMIEVEGSFGTYSICEHFIWQ